MQQLNTRLIVHIDAYLMTNIGQRNLLIQHFLQQSQSFFGLLLSQHFEQVLFYKIKLRAQHLPIGLHYGSHQNKERSHKAIAGTAAGKAFATVLLNINHIAYDGTYDGTEGTSHPPADRKSTRLNSSHVRISYAVF